jgi:hypothetical protein
MSRILAADHTPFTPSRHVGGHLLDAPSRACDLLTPLRIKQITWGFVLLGCLARLVRYLLCQPLWGDEAFLCASFLDRDYAGLMQPLEYGQVAPLLFLWVQLALVQLLGFSEYTLRLFPLLCGLASVMLFRHTASRVLQGTALVFAVAIFSVAYPGIRYACEAKPYGCDLLVSLGLISLVIEWFRQPGRTFWLWTLAAVAPLAVGFSYPAVFTYGGVSLAVAIGLFQNRSVRGLLPWIAMNFAVLGGFLALYAVSAGNQSARDLEGMRQCWGEAFPPLMQPLELVSWLAVTHGSEMMAYPVGGARGASTLTLVWCLCGVALVWREKRWWLLALCLAPLGLNFIAAALERYPYGARVRFMIYMGPMICLISGLGAAVLLRLVMRRRGTARMALVATVALFISVAVGSMGRDFFKPYKTQDFLRNRAFARWFWVNKAHDGELVCMKSDLGVSCSPETFSTHFSSIYLCNQRIYSPRHQSGEEPRWDRISSHWPLRCVQFRSTNFAYDQDAFDAWLESMLADFQLVDTDRYPMPVYHRDRDFKYMDWVEVYEFVPSTPRATENLQARIGTSSKHH